MRARNAVVGVEQVRRAAVRGQLRLAVVASDASHNSLDKVVPLLAARRIPHVEVPSAEELGAAVGRPSTAAVGVLNGDLARGIRALTAPEKPGAVRKGRAPGAR